MTSVERVVLLDEDGHDIGAVPKSQVHHGATPLHLAFSCYVLDHAGRLLLTRRALSKATFPGVWTNTVCGHPVPGEDLVTAVRRRARDELGLTVADVRLVLPEFRYRATMDGVVENEMCPVLVASPVGDPHPAPDEVDQIAWVPWAELSHDVLDGSRVISPWCRLQVEALVRLGPDPAAWPAADVHRLPPAARAA